MGWLERGDRNALIEYKLVGKQGRNERRKPDFDAGRKFELDLEKIGFKIRNL